MHFSAVLWLQKGYLYRWKKFIEGKQEALEELKQEYLRHTIRIDYVGWDSLAWERDDLGGVVEHKPGSKQTNQCYHSEG